MRGQRGITRCVLQRVRKAQTARVHWLIQNPKVRVHIWGEPRGLTGPSPQRPGPVRFLGGIGRGRLTVPERERSGFPHIAGEAHPSARCGCGAQDRGGGTRSCGALLSGDLGALRGLGGSREETLGGALQLGGGGGKQLEAECLRGAPPTPRNTKKPRRVK